jgi:chromate transport protein ChrA
MNIELLFSGIAALVLGLLFEFLIRISKSKTWWRTRLFIVLGILLNVAGNF